LLCLALAAAGIRRVLPAPRDTVVAAKLEGLASRADEVDTLFVGSSLTYRHVDPALFDARTTAAGRPTRSYNLGAPAMGLLEMRWLLEQVAALDLPRLRWVFLDPHGLGLELPDENRESARAIAWHDPAATWDALRLVGKADMEAGRARELVTNHLVAGFFHWGNVGRARLELERALLATADDRALQSERTRSAAGWARGPAGDGFLSLDEALATADADERAPLQARHDNFRESKRTEFASRVADALRAGPADASAHASLGPEAEQLFRDIARSVEALGAELVLFNAPSPGDLSLLHPARALGIGSAGLDFSDPGAHPALFRVDRRFDTRHLDAEGARLYTEALASGFLAQTDEDDDR
jgi:hypothetical protein